MNYKITQKNLYHKISRADSKIPEYIIYKSRNTHKLQKKGHNTIFMVSEYPERAIVQVWKRL